MPVIKKRVRIQENYGGPIVRAAQGGEVSALLRQGADVLAQQGRAFGKLMAQEASEKGQALAKAAVFSTGPNGLPQLPENASAQMGRAARKAYDATIEDRFIHQMQASVRASLEAAHNANMYDFGAFTAEAEQRMADMAQDVPEAYRGVFQQIGASAIAGIGASIGRREQQVADQNAVSRYPDMAAQQASSIRELVAVGDMDAARTMAEDVSWIDRIPTHLMTDGQKRDLKEQIWFETGIARLQNAPLSDGRELSDLTPGELGDLRERLILGEDEELAEFFTTPDGVVQQEWMRKAANLVSQFQAGANMRATAKRQVMEKRAEIDLLMGGAAENSKKNAELSDEVLGRMNRLTNEENPGTVRTMQPYDWLQMDPETRRQNVAWVKETGVVPASLHQLFRILKNSQDPEQLNLAFDLLRDLDEGENVTGKTVSLIGEAPERVQTMYTMVNELGWEPEQAIAQVDALRDFDWNPLEPGENDDKHLYRTMRDAGEGDEAWIGNDLTEENARERMKRAVNVEVFDDIDALPSEKKQAHLIFETMLASGNSWKASMDATKASMRDRFVETKYFANVKRSNRAPEKWYPQQGPGTVSELAVKRGLEAGASFMRASGFLTELPFRLLPGDLPQWGESRQRYAADWLEATTFERMADVKIREMVAELNEDALEDWGTGRPFLKPDRARGQPDYVLQPRGNDIPPTYNVQVVAPDGTLFPVGILDLREEWKQMNEFNVTIETIEKERRARAHEWATDPETIISEATAGRSPEYHTLIKRFYELSTAEDEKAADRVLRGFEDE